MATLIKQRYEEAVDVERLRPHPKNAKLHDLGSIGGSIEGNGFGGAIYAQENTGFILSGHGTLEAAIAAGFNTVPVIWMDVDDDTAENLLVAFNHAQEGAGYNEDLYATLLQGIADRGDYSAAGYDPDDVDDFLASIGRTMEVDPPDDGFQGGYADDAAARQGPMPTGTTTSRGLREMVLVLDADAYEQLQECVRLARGAFSLHDGTTGQVVLAAMQAWVDADS